MSRVLLVNMPFSNLRWPSLGPSLLQGALKHNGIACDMVYFGFDFAEQVGLDHYYWIADHFAFVLGGERLFAKYYFGDQLPDDDRYYHEVLLRVDAGLSETERHDYEQTEKHVVPFLDHCMEAVDWSQYSVVGFATSFQQTMPSMCLARRLKQRWPDTTIVFGGAACEGEMGIELLRQFPEVDYAFLGEADLTFPAVIKEILDGGPVEIPAGVVGRKSLATATSASVTPGCRPLPNAPEPSRFTVRDMDALPYPDFDDYFARHARSPLADDVESLLFYETSRGCWWGQKHHCRFCGLNGSRLNYRSKTPARAVEELRYLVERHHIQRACSADNILDHKYFDTFLPMLQESGIGLAFVYEMKVNLTRRQVQILLDSGMGAAQLGIETFSTPILKLVGKGANATQNLQALKWFSEPGIEVKWNILYGFPDEDASEYEKLADLLPSIVHLHPPLAVGRVRLDRFSPYFEDPARYGMINVGPNRSFNYVYPFSRDVLARLAYYYEYDYADAREPNKYAAEMLRQAEQWQDNKGAYTLRCFDRGDGLLLITDTRPCATQFQWRLSGPQRAIYRYCDTGRSLRHIVEFLRNGEDADSAPNVATIQQMLDRWVEARLMVNLDDRFLSLGLYAPGDYFATADAPAR